MEPYRVRLAMTVVTWLVPTGLAISLGSDRNFQIQSTRLILTELDTGDASQNEKLSSAAVCHVSAAFCNTLASLLVKATKVPGSWRQDEDSYQPSLSFTIQ
jgi:hypothetical protein